MPDIDQWHHLWRALGATAPCDIHAQLIARYTEAHRHYHTLQHLGECFANFAIARTLCKRPHEVELALWFHDAIYDVHRNDNEECSASWAHRCVLSAGLDPDVGTRVHALVMATRHDAAPHDDDARVLVDVDLWILAAGEARFDEYEQQVRAEYRWVPDLLYRRGRIKVLRGFLARPRIFSTEPFAMRFESAARANLKRSLRQLGG